MGQQHEDRRVGIIGGLILTVLTVATGGSVYTVMRHQTEEILCTSLENSLQSYQRLFESQIHDGILDSFVIASRPFVNQNLELGNAEPGSAEARAGLRRIAESFLPTGFMGVAFHDRRGTQLARAGRFAQEPELSVPLHTEIRAFLLWDGGFVLRSYREVVDLQGRRAGTVTTDMSLPGLTRAVSEARTIGESAELAICGALGRDMQCFPFTLYNKVRKRMPRDIEGEALPMAYALDGKSGLAFTKDYRREDVVATYAPLGTLGLGMVLKVDQRDLYSPLAERLQVVVPLLGALVLGGILLLYGTVTPLVRRLVSSEQEKKAANVLLWRQANFDKLTGLPNRDMFRDRLWQEMKKADRSQTSLALLFIDLDKFKEVNDTLGHDAGDLLLQLAANRIRACVRESDTVARLGGDEFTVILPELSDGSHIEDIAQKIVAAVADPYRLNHELAFVSASVGITLYPSDAGDIENLMKNADQAMYAAKSKGRNRFSYFTASLQAAAQTRLRLSNDLREAIAAQQLSVCFQPIVELDTGRIRKAEALLRWKHPERGMVDPSEFIPIAEETGLIHEIGDWAFNEAARWAVQWADRLDPDFQVSVNKSPAQFRAESNCTAPGWLYYMDQLGVASKNIAVEITEGMLLNADEPVIEKLLAFRNAGAQIAIDDFGTGYSSLAYLKKFHIDYIKLDRSFIRDLATDNSDRTLSHAVIVMAHQLGLKVIAEGVETEEQRAMLVAVGCDYAQGYLYSRPLPGREFEAFMQRPANAQSI